MSDVIQPIVEWAILNDSNRIQSIYLKDGFTPNTENAKEWKILLDTYKSKIKE